MPEGARGVDPATRTRRGPGSVRLLARAWDDFQSEIESVMRGPATTSWSEPSRVGAGRQWGVERDGFTCAFTVGVGRSPSADLLGPDRGPRSRGAAGVGDVAGERRDRARGGIRGTGSRSLASANAPVSAGVWMSACSFAFRPWPDLVADAFTRLPPQSRLRRWVLARG